MRRHLAHATHTRAGAGYGHTTDYTVQVFIDRYRPAEARDLNIISRYLLEMKVLTVKLVWINFSHKE